MWKQRQENKFELIDGVVYMASPTKYAHGSYRGSLAAVLGAYALATPGVELLDNATNRLDEDSEPQPDLALWLPPERGGRSRIDADGYVAGAVELIVEVAASSASYDLHRKKELYRRHGCPEYLGVVIHSREVLWFALRDGRYAALAPDAAGILRSAVFPGLWLDAPALIERDAVRLDASLKGGLATPEHAAFVAALGRPRS